MNSKCEVNICFAFAFALSPFLFKAVWGQGRIPQGYQNMTRLPTKGKNPDWLYTMHCNVNLALMQGKGFRGAKQRKTQEP